MIDTHKVPSKIRELINEFTTDPRFQGAARFDQTTRFLYSTDASIYQIEPLGVVFPRTADDLAAAVEIAARNKVPILPRGSGSSLAGQAVGPALVLDCSRYLNKILKVDPEQRTAIVEPGVILSALNRAAAPYHLQFGPDPASADRATIGGSIANNAAGAHSIIYGMTADHILAIDAILSDGSQATFKSISIDEAQKKSQVGNSIEGSFYKAALKIKQTYRDEIKTRWPTVWRRCSGYNLNYLLPWSSTRPPQWDLSRTTWGGLTPMDLPYPPLYPNEFNLASLLAGSEGTLAVIQRAVLRLVPLPRYTVLGVMGYESIASACEAVPGILALLPAAVELIPESLMCLARSVPAYSHQMDFLKQLKPNGSDPAAILVVEFAGDDPELLRKQANLLGKGAFIAEQDGLKKKIWDVRKVGLGILMSRPGDQKPVAFIEDTSVPVDHLAQFVKEMEHMLGEYGTQADYYAHASAGCLHIRPMINLKTRGGVLNLRSIAEKTAALTLRLGGAVSAEHGDGLARSEWLELAYGKSILQAFQELKNAVDPDRLLNPGKIVNPQPMDQSLRYGETYHAQAWQPIFTFSNPNPSIGLLEAIEQCNGAGVCRKADGVMCPSFQASQDEMHSTRGRANLLRAMISGYFPTQNLAQKAVREALDLCLACKGCKAECPSGVDVARLKYEFFNHYYSQPGHPRRLRDYLFGYIGVVASLAHPIAPLANVVLGSRIFTWAGDCWLGLSKQRPFPRFSSLALGKRWRKQGIGHKGGEEVLFLSDAFTEYFYPQAGMAALQVLSAAGCRVHILPVLGAGRTLISKGFLPAARKQAERVLRAIDKLDPSGHMPIVGVEPSEILTLRDEFLDFFGDSDQVHSLANRSWMVDEFLLRPGPAGKKRIDRLEIKTGEKVKKKVFLHGHCYQKAQPPADDGIESGVTATVAVLKTCGYPVQLIDSSCCGMAGAFGYEKEHYEFSQKVAELSLFPAVRAALARDTDGIISASGVSCQAQIEDGTGHATIHPIVLVNEARSSP